MKYLLSALLLCGAFFSYAQYAALPEYHCPDGGVLQEHGGNMVCAVAAQFGQQYVVSRDGKQGVSSSIPSAAASLASQLTTQYEYGGCPASNTWSYKSHSDTTSSVSFDVILERQKKVSGSCKMEIGYPRTESAVASWGMLQPQYYCPPDSAPDFTTPIGSGTDTICTKPAEALPTDEEPPPECDDIVGNCEPDPQCVQGGGGMMVCKDNPEDKCWVDEWGHTQCQEGCGFVGETFFCATQPDPDEMPNFDKCKFTFNGYACPSEPDDEITDPEKPLPDMKKQDFKDVNVGVETRQDVTNDLLETLISTNISESENLSKTLGDKLDEGNAGTGKSNNYLKEIDLNTKAMADDIAEFTKSGEIDPLPPEPESWYESEYEDGLKGIWEEKQPLLMATPLFSFVDQFNINPNGNPPDFEMCFNLGAMGNYGCDSFEVPQWVWNAIKVFILFTAAILCRAAVTGV